MDDRNYRQPIIKSNIQTHVIIPKSSISFLYFSGIISRPALPKALSTTKGQIQLMRIPSDFKYYMKIKILKNEPII